MNKLEFIMEINSQTLIKPTLLGEHYLKTQIQRCKTILNSFFKHKYQAVLNQQTLLVNRFSSLECIYAHQKIKQEQLLQSDKITLIRNKNQLINSIDLCKIKCYEIRKNKESISNKIVIINKQIKEKQQNFVEFTHQTKNKQTSNLSQYNLIKKETGIQCVKLLNSKVQNMKMCLRADQSSLKTKAIQFKTNIERITNDLQQKQSQNINLEKRISETLNKLQQLKNENNQNLNNQNSNIQRRADIQSEINKRKYQQIQLEMRMKNAKQKLDQEVRKNKQLLGIRQEILSSLKEFSRQNNRIREQINKVHEEMNSCLILGMQ